MHKLRTLDVWDTLLRRRSHPECVKLATARHLLLAGKFRLRPQHAGQWPLYHARVGIERRLAKAARASGNDAEYEINAVMAAWLGEVSLDAMPAANIDPLARELVEIEFRFEQRHSVADPEILDFLSAYPAARTVFLSDFYMSAKTLGALLHAKGLGQIASEGLSSSDVGLNKRSGRLFKHVHALYGIPPRDHIHIGDDPWSDIAAARRGGVTAVHYLPETAHASRLQREWLFLSRQVLFAHVRAACQEDARRLTPEMRSDGAFDLGIEAAPLFIGFMLWIAEQVLVSRCDAIWFRAATGAFLSRLYAGMFPDAQCFDHPLPSAEVLSSDAQSMPLAESTPSPKAKSACFTLGQYLERGDATNDPSLNALNTLCESADHQDLESTCDTVFAARFQQGVLFAVSRWRPYVESYVLDASEMLGLSTRIRDALGSRGYRRLAREMVAHPGRDVFHLTPSATYDIVPSLATIVLSGVNLRKRAELVQFMQRVRWSAALQNCKDLGRFHRGGLLLAFGLAHAFRSMKFRLSR